MLSGKDGNNTRKVAPLKPLNSGAAQAGTQDLREHSYSGSVATFSGFEGRAQEEGIISTKTPTTADGVKPMKFYSKSESSRDFYLSTKAPTRTSFAAALREDKSSLDQMSEVYKKKKSFVVFPIVLLNQFVPQFERKVRCL